MIFARADSAWTEIKLSETLKEAVTGYPSVQAMRASSFALAFEIGPAISGDESTSTAHVEKVRQDGGWDGMGFASADGKSIATFSRDRFAFSRMNGYEDWNQFSHEALRLWAIHAQVAQVTEIQRIGVRFINRIELPSAEVSVNEYFRGFGSSPGELPSAGFVYQDSLAVPTKRLIVNVVRTIQMPNPNQGLSPALILDIDAFCSEPFDVDRATIERKLRELHWLTNRVFFGSITAKVVETYR